MTAPYDPVRAALAAYRIDPPAGPFVLDVAATVVLDGTGYGVVRLGPTGRQRWRVTQLGVTVSTNAAEPTARVYLGRISPATFLAGSYTGSNDSTDLAVEVMTGGLVLVEWRDGDPGALATASLYGSYTLR